MHDNIRSLEEQHKHTRKSKQISEPEPEFFNSKMRVAGSEGTDSDVDTSTD